MKRVHIWIEGEVQGVFFRSFAVEEAEKLGIKGWVRNLSDGRVEAVAEGEDLNVDSFIQKMRQGPRGARVKEVEIKAEAYLKEFNFFLRRS